MKISNFEAVPSKTVEMDGADGCTVRWLIDENDGAPNFSMRRFEVSPGGHTPRHSHPYEHEVFVLEGNGTIVEGDAEHPLQAGDAVLVKPNEVHQFCNTGDSPLKFLCMVPNNATKKTVTVAPECGAEQ